MTKQWVNYKARCMQIDELDIESLRLGQPPINDEF
jgi:hypothetical protein